MLQFFSNIKKYLLPVWIKIRPSLLPIIDYFNKGTLGTALFLAFMLLLALWVVLWGLTPMLLSNFRSPITLIGEELVDLRPRQWQRYTIETDGAVPIGIRSWFEQREYGVITTYRSNDSYWGVYLVGDYFIYLQSDRDDDLERPPQTLTGRFSSLDTSTLTRLDELMPDMPDTVLALRYMPQSLAGDVEQSLVLTFLGGMLLAMAWFFHHQAIKRNGGQLNSPLYIRLLQAIRPVASLIRTIWDWTWKIIKSLFSGGMRSAIQSFMQASQDGQGTNSSNDGADGRVIRIDPSKVRQHKDDER